MEDIFMKEVEQEINRILSKNKQKNPQACEFCNSQNLEACLKEVSQEFDYLNVSCMDDEFKLDNKSTIKNVLIQLVNSSYNLIKLYRDTQRQQNESSDRHSKLFNDVKSLMVTVDSLRKEIVSKERELQILKEQTSLDNLLNIELKNKLQDAKKEVITYKQHSIKEKNRHKHEINKVMNESKLLEARFKKDSSTYVSQEGHIVSVIDGYKTNEQKHLQMIQQLQENNQLLLEEILTLKAELAAVSFKHRKI